MNTDKLSETIKVPFSALHLDINNPRLGREQPIGYEKAAALFDSKSQSEAQAALEDRYQKLGELVAAIEAQGWLPIDSIIVWEHPDRPGQYVVVEGNTRTTALRKIRANLLEAKAELVRRQKKPAAADLIEETQRKVDALSRVVAATEQIEVRQVNVKTAAELEAVLPNILGVRHIKHAQHWGPFAQNLYLYKLYEAKFRDKHGAAEKLKIDDALIKELGGIISQGDVQTRQNIQSASAFLRFKTRYETKMPNGEELTDRDHYFFQQILENKYPREQFKFGDGDLELRPEMEEVLFKWAFAKPRKGAKGEDNPNILYKAENMRDWHNMSVYDVKPQNKTSFASQLDVNNPDAAPKFYELSAEFLNDKAKRGPSKLIDKLIKQLNSIPMETVLEQQGHLRAQLEQLHQITGKALKVIAAVEEK
jgi:hypothetical protein